MAENSYSVFNAMVDIVAAPRKALGEVKLHTSWLWWPLLIGILLASGMFYYYYSWVDFPWLVDETIRQLPAESRAESADSVRAFMQAETSMWTSIIAVFVMSFVIYLIQAAYFHLANKLTTGAAVTYGQWFSFGVWTGFVGVFGSLAAFVTMFMADSNQLATESLAVFSLNFAAVPCQSRRAVVHLGQFADPGELLDDVPGKHRLRPLDRCLHDEIYRHCRTSLGSHIRHLGHHNLTVAPHEKIPDFCRPGSAAGGAAPDCEVDQWQ